MHPLLNAIGFFILLITLIVFLIFIIKLVIYFLKRKDFPRKTLASTLIGVLLFLGIFIYIQYFFSFNDINSKYMQEGPEISSPKGKYTANAYYELYGGAAGGVNVWIEITNNIENTNKIIYYADAKNNIHMNWVDEESLSITNTGGGVPNLNVKEVEKFLMLVPPLKEQQKIASILSTVDEQIEVYEQEKAKYEELKKGLMQKLLTGQIRVKC